MEDDTKPTPERWPWDNNELQFARLLCEICWSQDIDVGALKESMGFVDDPHMFEELLGRAWRVYMDYLKNSCGEDESQFKPLIRVCSEHGEAFDDNPGKSVCKTCEDWK